MVTFKGNCEWRQVADPVPKKNDWGVDEVVIPWQGRVDKLPQFMATLHQGTAISYMGGTFYLQTWQGEEHRSFPTVNLAYKGFANGRLPDADVKYSTAQKSGSKTVVLSTPDHDRDGNEVFQRTYDFLYISPCRIYRYLANSQGFNSPPPLQVDQATIIQSFYTDPDGRKIVGQPSGLGLVGSIEGHDQEKIQGTSLWETTITVAGIVQT